MVSYFVTPITMLCLHNAIVLILTVHVIQHNIREKQSKQELQIYSLRAITSLSVHWILSLFSTVQYNRVYTLLYCTVVQ